MTEIRNATLRRRDAERLLERSRAGERAQPAELQALLTAACAAPTDTPVAGEDAAALLFREIARTPVPRRQSVIKTLAAKLVAAKLLAAGAVVATGGVALAAASGTLPGPLGHPGHGPNSHASATAHPSRSASATASASTSSAEPEDTESVKSTASDTGSASPSSTADSAAHTPSPSLVGLCHAFQAGATNNPGAALKNPAFSALVTAAGGQNSVSAYCVTLIGAPTSHPTDTASAQLSEAPSSHPGGAPSSHPGGAPSTHPTGAPSSHPSGAPATHPTGAPSTHPGRR